MYHGQLFFSANRWRLDVLTFLIKDLTYYQSVTSCIDSICAATSNGESNSGQQSKSETYTKIVSGSRRGREIIKSLVQRPRRTFTKKQIEEHNLGIILIVMSSLFIFCQSFKIIPDMYEIFQCNRLGKYGGNCEMKGPVSF